MNDPFETVTVYCEANVAGESVIVRHAIPKVAAEDPELMAVLRDSLRHRLVDAILDRWKPVVRIR